MNVLEKILEEMENRVNFRKRLVRYEKKKGTITDVVRNQGALEELVIVEKIICSHMDETISEMEKVEKEKVTSAEIISREIDGKPYYEIKFKKVGEDEYTIGYSSFKLDYVIKWLNDYFALCGEAKVSCENDRDGKMNILEKILEKIEHEAMTNKEIGRKQCEGMTRAMNVIRSHMNVVTDICVGSKNGWIPCSEMLPKEDSYGYIISCSGGIVRTGVSYGYANDEDKEPCFYKYDDEFWDCYRYNDVVAWQPLPEPYKGE